MLDGKLLVDRGRFLLYETQRVVVPFIMEINFSSKVYSKSLLNGSHDVTCLLLYHSVIPCNIYILKDPKISSTSSPQYGRFICFFI